MTLKLPIQLAANGQLAAHEGDSVADVAQSVALLLDTRIGERRSVPDYGTLDPLFDQVDPAVLRDAISTWEPRADEPLVRQLTAETDTSQHVEVWIDEDLTDYYPDDQEG